MSNALDDGDQAFVPLQIEESTVGAEVRAILDIAQAPDPRFVVEAIDRPLETPTRGATSASSNRPAAVRRGLDPDPTADPPDRAQRWRGPPSLKGGGGVGVSIELWAQLETFRRSRIRQAPSRRSNVSM